MLIDKDIIKLYMEREEVEYLEERLKSALINRYFYPAEICERKYQNRYVTIYCTVVGTT